MIKDNLETKNKTICKEMKNICMISNQKQTRKLI